MSREYIITMTAENRVGILAAVTNAMAELGAELREASQTVVRGFFTMIFAAEFPEDREEHVILDHLHGVCRPFDIEVSMSPSDAGSTTPADTESVIKRLHIRGRNVPGILRRIGVKMSMDQIDIVGMHAWRESAERFEMVMKLAIPGGYATEQLPDELRALNPDWELDVQLDDYQPVSAFTNEA